MFEYDYNSAIRKFAATKAMVQVGGKPPEWRNIYKIDDLGCVWEKGVREAIGETLYEVNEYKKQTEKLPIVNFIYAPIICGFYQGARAIFKIERKHIKSWKVGLSNEAYSIKKLQYGHFAETPYYDDFDLTNPLEVAKIDEGCEFLGGGLNRFHSSLKFLGTDLGFIDNDKLILKHKAFEPLIKSYVGEKWQILNF